MGKTIAVVGALGVRGTAYVPAVHKKRSDDIRPFFVL